MVSNPLIGTWRLRSWENRSVLDGHMPAEKLLHYREYHQGLPGHPEKLLTPSSACSENSDWD